MIEILIGLFLYSTKKAVAIDWLQAGPFFLKRLQPITVFVFPLGVTKNFTCKQQNTVLFTVLQKFLNLFTNNNGPKRAPSREL